MPIICQNIGSDTIVLTKIRRFLDGSKRSFLDVTPKCLAVLLYLDFGP